MCVGVGFGQVYVCDGWIVKYGYWYGVYVGQFGVFVKQVFGYVVVLCGGYGC